MSSGSGPQSKEELATTNVLNVARRSTVLPQDPGLATEISVRRNGSAMTRWPQRDFSSAG
jgi:hypothetical protein